MRAQPTTPPVRPPEDRVRRLAELADWQDRWAQRHLDGPFHPRGAESDYNEHYADVDDDDDEFHAVARAIMGVDNHTLVDDDLHHDKVDALLRELGIASPSVEKADQGIVGDYRARHLHEYWTHGKGLARWLDSPHPWTALYHGLLEYIKNPEIAKKTASKWFHDATGLWSGERKGKNPVGPG